MSTAPTTLAFPATGVKRIALSRECVLRIIETIEPGENNEIIVLPQPVVTDFLVDRSALSKAGPFLKTMLTSDKFADTGKAVVTLTDTVDADTMRLILCLVCPEFVLDANAASAYPPEDVNTILASLDFLLIDASHWSNKSFDIWLNAWMEANPEAFSDPGLRLSVIYHLGTNSLFSSFCHNLITHAPEDELVLVPPEGIPDREILFEISSRLCAIHNRVREQLLEVLESRLKVLATRRHPSVEYEYDIRMFVHHIHSLEIGPHTPVDRLNQLLTLTWDKFGGGYQDKLELAEVFNGVCRDCFKRSFHYGHNLDLPTWTEWKKQHRWDLDCKTEHPRAAFLDCWINKNYQQLVNLVQVLNTDCLKHELMLQLIVARGRQYGRPKGYLHTMVGPWYVSVTLCDYIYGKGYLMLTDKALEETRYFYADPPHLRDISGKTAILFSEYFFYRLSYKNARAWNHTHNWLALQPWLNWDELEVMIEEYDLRRRANMLRSVTTDTGH